MHTVMHTYYSIARGVLCTLLQPTPSRQKISRLIVFFWFPRTNCTGLAVRYSTVLYRSNKDFCCTKKDLFHKKR